MPRSVTPVLSECSVAYVQLVKDKDLSVAVRTNVFCCKLCTFCNKVFMAAVKEKREIKFVKSLSDIAVVCWVRLYIN